MGSFNGVCGSCISLWGGWNKLHDLSHENTRIEFNDGIGFIDGDFNIDPSPDLDMDTFVFGLRIDR